MMIYKIAEKGAYTEDRLSAVDYFMEIAEVVAKSPRVWETMLGPC